MKPRTSEIDRSFMSFSMISFVRKTLIMLIATFQRNKVKTVKKHHRKKNSMTLGLSARIAFQNHAAGYDNAKNVPNNTKKLKTTFKIGKITATTKSIMKPFTGCKP